MSDEIGYDRETRDDITSPTFVPPDSAIEQGSEFKELRRDVEPRAEEEGPLTEHKDAISLDHPKASVEFMHLEKRVRDLLEKTKDDLETAEADITALESMVSPIGAIAAWHKSMTGVPALPANWVECDGSAISDSDSPMDGETLPDLNGDLAFIRGGAVSSNTKQDDAFQGHYHDVKYQAIAAATAGAHMVGDGSSGAKSGYATTPVADGVNGTPRIATETRPVNMTMVWIMRIK